MKNRIIDVQNIKITVSKEELDDYICITDIAFEIIGAPCVWKYIGRTLTETGSHSNSSPYLYKPHKMCYCYTIFSTLRQRVLMRK